MVSQRVLYYSEALIKLRSFDVFFKSRTNALLGNAERLELDGLLSEGKTELDQFQDMILDLQEILNVIHQEKSALERHLACAKSLISPIRKLPTEILGEIFSQHGVCNRFQQYSDYPGLKMASVSSHWRSVALSTPALWQTFSIENSIADVYHPGQYQLLRRMLLLSSLSPLNIRITIRPSVYRSFSMIHPALRLLWAQAHRWKTLDIEDRSLSGSSPHFANAFSHLTGQLEELTKFQYHGSCVLLSRYNFLVENAPSLHTLSLANFEFSNHLRLPWSQITQFTATMSLNSEIVKALSRMTMLHTFNVYNPDTVLVPAGDESRNNGVESPMVLANLRKLYIQIIDFALHEQEIEDLFIMLTTPNLTSLTIEIEKPADREDEPERRWTATHLLALLERSRPPLTHLDLFIWLPVEALLRLLASFPTIATLRIVEPPATVMLTDDFLQLRHDKRVLLPNLTSLELGMSLLSLERQQLLVKTLESRWDRSLDDRDTQQHVSRLTSVSLSLQEDTIDPSIVGSLMRLRRRGLVVSARDECGDITLRE